MTDIKDIKDRDIFEAWLDALPQGAEADKTRSRSIAVALANRSAARVLPIIWDWTLNSDTSRKDYLTALPFLRSVVISSVATRASNNDIRHIAYTAANAAHTAVNAATLNSATTNAAAHAAKANIANAVVYVVANTANAATPNSAAAAAAQESAAATANVAAAAAIWAEIRGDCQHLVSAPDLLDRPLWAASGTAPDDLWPDLKRRVLEQPGDWRFWVDWYDSLRTGKQMNIGLLSKVVQIEPETWNKGASVVNPMINDMWDQFDPSELEGLADEPDLQPLTETPYQLLSKNARVVSMQLDTLIEFLRQQINQLIGNNHIADTDARADRVLQLRAILEKVQEIADAFPKGADPASNALALIEENLPAVVEQAENLPAVVGVPEVSERIHTLAAGVKVLSDAGMTGDSAAKYVAAEMGSKSLGKTISAWWRNRNVKQE